jgi:hypothetical protein
MKEGSLTGLTHECIYYLLTLLLCFSTIAFGLVEPQSAFLVFGIVFVLLLILFLLKIFGGGQDSGFVKDKTLLPAAAFVLLSGLSVFWSPSFSLSERFWIYVVAGLALYATVSNLQLPRRAVYAGLGLLILLGVGLCLYGLVQYFAAEPKVLNHVKTFYKGSLTATYINRNHFAGLLEMLIPLTLGTLFAGRKKNSTPLCSPS